MLPLQVDDLLPLDEYASRRREFFDSHRRYIDRYRRVRIGPRLTLIFENRQTLWFRVQEIMRIARLADAKQVQQELNLYNRLLPGRNLLQAALLIEIADEAHLAQEMAAWKDLCRRATLPARRQGFLSVDFGHLPARRSLHRHRPLGPVRPRQPGSRPAARQQPPAFFAFDNGTYQHHSALLSEEHRQSLLDDLELSDRD